MVSSSTLEVVREMLSVFITLEVSQLVPPWDMLQVDGQLLAVMDIEYEYELILEAMLKFASEAELYFAVKNDIWLIAFFVAYP